MTKRTSTDYALEFAEYMAKGAEELIEAVNALAMAEQARDDGDGDELDAKVDEARQDCSEHLTGLRNDIYQFRTRRDRAAREAATRKEPHNGNDKEPRDPESFAYLDARGDDEGQGLDSYWKWGFAAGWNDHKKHAAKEREELERLRELVNTPTLHSFRDGVVLEAAHQRARWGADHDAGKAPADWFWLVGYLAGKALHAQTSGNAEKALHHTISTAAALANWHAAISGEHTAMRPGIDPAAHGLAA